MGFSCFVVSFSAGALEVFLFGAGAALPSVALSTILEANTFISRGRLGFFERSSIQKFKHKSCLIARGIKFKMTHYPNSRKDHLYKIIVQGRDHCRHRHSPC